MKLTFLGAVEEVTGSKYLVEHEGTKILVDCGLFQGEQELTQHNWDKFPIQPSSIDAVIITHPHIDHAGYIPVLVNKGFSGPIYCSHPAKAVCTIALIDSGRVHEAEAKKGTTNHARPLYTEEDAERALSFFHSVDYDTAFSVGSLTVTLIRSGHILGASFVIITDGNTTLTFSGDLGRPNQLIMPAPPHLTHTDFLVLESTYGNKRHQDDDPITKLSQTINTTIQRGGVVVIPAFAIDRTQEILYSLYQLKQKNAIPDVPIFLDSPMAIKITQLYCDFTQEHKLSRATCDTIAQLAIPTKTVEESKQINFIDHNAIIIAGSGMASGGRVLRHLQHYISDSKNTVLLVGYQAEGTTGRALLDGASTITINDQIYDVHAEIRMIETLSAHADYQEILDWLSHFKNEPKKIFITHGERAAALSLQKKIEDRFGWNAVVPKYLESFDLA